MLGSSEHFLGYLRPGLIPGVVDKDSPLLESTKETARLRVIEGTSSLGDDTEVPVRPGVSLGYLPDDRQRFLHGVEGRVLGPRARQVGVALVDKPNDPLDLPPGGLDPLRGVTR
jgi:hypothetical protein